MYGVHSKFINRTKSPCKRDEANSQRFFHARNGFAWGLRNEWNGPSVWNLIRFSVYRRARPFFRSRETNSETETDVGRAREREGGSHTRIISIRLRPYDWLKSSAEKTFGDAINCECVKNIKKNHGKQCIFNKVLVDDARRYSGCEWQTVPKPVDIAR